MDKMNIGCSTLALLAALGCAPACATVPQIARLADRSLEQLGGIVVTSISRPETRLADAAASIFIINAEDIRRSGAGSLPEALRLAPNLQVGRVDARNHAITVRGFNSPFENKLLVPINGCRLYTPRSFGAFLDGQDLILDHAERIEVISGPDRHDGGLTLQGDGYHGDPHQPGTTDIRIAANLLGRLNQTLAHRSNLRLQVYLDPAQRDQPRAYKETINTLDLKFQHVVPLAQTHRLVWGSEYRYTRDRVQNDAAFAFLSGPLNMHLGNGFVQGEVELCNNLRLTTGTKLAHNSYTGLQSLPIVRVAWTPATNHSIWDSASRTVRAPSRIDRAFFAATGPTIADRVSRFTVVGSPHVVSEVAQELEIGYRAQPGSAVSYSLTAFYSIYDKLRMLEPNPAGFGSIFSNEAQGTARGTGMRSRWRVADSWRPAGGLITQWIDPQLKPGSAEPSGSAGLANNDPSHYRMPRSSYDISDTKQLAVAAGHAGALPRSAVPAYHSMNARFDWKLRPDPKLSMVGQHLPDSSQVEFGAAPARSEFDRSLFLKMLWRLWT
jgi:iron complex outermembrane receptor protein